MALIFTYLIGVVVVGLLDVLWLGVVMKEFYFSRLGHLLAPSFNFYAAATFYLVYVLGIMYFAVLPNASKGILAVVVAGALFGIFAYATYDLTNMATLAKWPLSITLIDIAWGACISGASAAVAYLAGRFFGAF